MWRKPLPLGPVELVPEDCLTIGLLALLGKTVPGFSSLYAINCFLMAYISISIVPFWKMGSSVFGYCVILLLGFIPQFWKSQWVDFGILAGTYFLVHEGQWRAFCRFPWQTEGFWRDIGIITAPGETVTNPTCGWSFDRFHRDITTAKRVDRIDAVLGCMLGSWWLFSITSLIEDTRDHRLACAVAAALAIVGSAIIRLCIYAHGCRPPISFWGRIWTFRWIIPGYDQLFVGPICSVLGAFLVLSLLRYQVIPAEVCYAAAGGVALLFALISPPPLKRFRLTGKTDLLQRSQKHSQPKLSRVDHEHAGAERQGKWAAAGFRGDTQEALPALSPRAHFPVPMANE